MSYYIANLSEAAPGRELLISAAFIAGLYCVARVLYQLCLHPLAGFRGPRQAALSTWWLYSISKSGQAPQVFEELHRRYNTRVLRVGPNEVHISDSSLYHTIYSQDHAFTKDPYFYDAFGTPHSVFVETDRALHRQRRKLLGKFFSKTSKRELQNVLYRQMEKLCNLLAKRSETDSEEPLNIYNAARCLTLDIISDIAFGRSLDTLSSAKGSTFESSLLHALDLAAHSIWDMMYIPQLRALMGNMPLALTNWLGGPAVHFARLTENIKSVVEKFKDLKSAGKSFDHAVVFDDLTELDDTSLIAEATDILVAGSDTTATTLAVALYQLTHIPEVYAALKHEIRNADLKTPEDFDLTRLEQFPYLSATVKEALRFANAVPGRLPRVVPSPQSKAGVLEVDGKVIPEGTIVSISAYMVLFDESIWGSDAQTFNPKRWLSDEGRQLDKYLVTFSKGARQCLGINLANAELTLALAMIVSRFDLTADDTLTDLDMKSYDGFTRSYKDGPGPRLKVSIL
ncbi:hypothetical protein PFICI_10813 [Pestalotiopsis fici W106-1]|uniref:Uncharacterized protein n=1 Tax=Pestalotiopsis fici (strain W106-1 / CGMCC3.15140) TaxID=1229662 RepID=W3WSZ2_PESFW|nr:uncharacterized protein PFICI_10813 [Pestalotiopsis fici W106-1]ETS76939.1 hypothetical protein PFICI_10813 [Pestalotiopsis fici W106-1]